jgi:hypothetical protein
MWENSHMFKLPHSVRELQPHAIWYVIERVIIAGLVGRGGGEVFHVNSLDLGLLTLGLILLIRPLIVKKPKGPSVDERIESLSQKWIDEAEARSHLATSTRDTITGVSRRIDDVKVDLEKQLAANRHWTDSVNGKVGDLKEQVAILITDYLKRQEGKT